MLDDVLHLLSVSPVVRRFQVVELIIYGQNAFRIKVRAEVSGELALQIWLNHNPRHTRYAYQLLQHDQTLMRWDNAPHHPEVAENFPHHIHDAQGRLAISSLLGDPLVDLPVVLAEIGSDVRGRAA